MYAKLGTRNRGQVAENYFRQALEQAAMVAERERGAANQGSSLLPLSGPMFALYNGLAGDEASCRRYLDRILEPENRSRISKMDLAQIYTALGEQDRALDLLEQASEEKDKALVYMGVHPFLEPLRSAQRFRDLQKRMHL